jgi:hypothetical protein
MWGGALVKQKQLAGDRKGEKLSYPNTPFNNVAKDKLKYTNDVVIWSFVCLCHVEHHVAHAIDEK